ncbi:MAG: tRNA 2-thiouridine(34) synthase MnmA [Anaerolineales bacterium]|jgi:tRNA-specific 2-thiouridylase|nr:tRNA 2-thiouridine(34) synthase MnmA [Anaerolineales bacterium]
MMQDSAAGAKRVVIAMSGGVDSSVAAALLVQQGYQVIGMMMRLWSETGQENTNRCCTPDAMAMARRVATRLGIPFYALDAQQIFFDTVVKDFIGGYVRGETPNPCLVCNRHIRWGFLLGQALASGADYLATGHYVRLKHDASGKITVRKGVDIHKDQSYVLYMLNQSQLSHAMFPLGGFTKPEVRQLARDFNLPVAERPESQDLCFLGDQDYPQFLARHAPQAIQPGPIQNKQGIILGIHQGLASYTIGQRKGLGISAPEPMYVLEKDLINNALIVGTVAELGKNTLIAGNVNWISGITPETEFRAQVKIRYKAQPAWANISPLPHDQIRIQFEQPLRDITPGQAAVIYDGEECLGGGIIQA